MTAGEDANRGDEPRDIDPFAPSLPEPEKSIDELLALPDDLGGHAREPMVAGSDSGGDGVLAFLKELPVLLLIAFGLAFLLRTFVIQVFYIPSGSMLDTLEINDRIVVEKISYRFREPARGEIIVFEGDERLAEENGAVGRVIRGVGQFIGLVPVNAQDFVKRVIGLPGDTVEIENGVVSVNGVELEEPYVEFSDGGTSGPFEVPAGSLFVMGDNRPSSSDSRAGLGYIDIDDVVGRAFVTIWPLDRAGTHGMPDYGDVPDAEPAPVEQPSASEPG